MKKIVIETDMDEKEIWNLFSELSFLYDFNKKKVKSTKTYVKGDTIVVEAKKWK